MSFDDVADSFLVAVGVGLVVAGTMGFQQTFNVILVDDTFPGWQGYAGWLLTAGLVICALGWMLGLRGVSGFTSLPATAGSMIGTLIAVTMVGKLLVRDVRLHRGLVCEGAVVSIQYAPRHHLRKPYLVMTKVQKMVSGGVEPEWLAFRVRDQERLRVGTGLRMEYHKPWRWVDLKTRFRRKMQEALEDAVSVSIRQ